MKHLPNILSLLRIAGAVALLLCDVVGTTFWALYALCGISDIADGGLARKLKCVTPLCHRRHPLLTLNTYGHHHHCCAKPHSSQIDAVYHRNLE